MKGGTLEKIETSIYIHIPFCEHKCIYCDFYSITDKSKIKAFLDSLKKEINFYAKKYAHNREIISIFFGGGTPSVLQVKELSTIINLIKSKFTLRSDAEITIESNPGTLDKIKINEIKSIGVNRLSIGVQSFKDDDLRFLSRIHTSEEAVKTVLAAVDAGIANINVDLIFGLPGQSLAQWKQNLNKACELPVTHISAYSLIVEKGTPLFGMVEAGKVQTLSNETDAEFYETTIKSLHKNGFEQYEVSNFCKPGFECVHNNSCWRYKDYISFGPSAHSFDGKKRWQNVSSVDKYITLVNNNGSASETEEIITEDQRLFEYLMLALRSKGIEIFELEQKFGSRWLNEKKTELQKLMEQGFLNLSDNFIKLTAKGYTLCDEILTRIL